MVVDIKPSSICLKGKDNSILKWCLIKCSTTSSKCSSSSTSNNSQCRCSNTLTTWSTEYLAANHSPTNSTDHHQANLNQMMMDLRISTPTIWQKTPSLITTNSDNQMKVTYNTEITLDHQMNKKKAKVKKKMMSFHLRIRYHLLTLIRLLNLCFLAVSHPSSLNLWWSYQIQYKLGEGGAVLITEGMMKDLEELSLQWFLKALRTLRSWKSSIQGRISCKFQVKSSSSLSTDDLLIVDLMIFLCKARSMTSSSHHQIRREK